MKTLVQGIRKFFSDDKGLETVEYAIAAGLITVAAITAITLVGTNVAAKFNVLASHLAP